jgi:hypothetical protein
MNQELYKTLLTFTNEELVNITDACRLDLPSHGMARRILKDRLEGLDEMVKSEVLHDKIVGA